MNNSLLSIQKNTLGVIWSNFICSFNQIDAISAYSKLFKWYLKLMVCFKLMMVLVVLFIFNSYYLLYYNAISRRFNLLMTFILVTLKDHGHSFFFSFFFSIMVFMFCLNTLCKRFSSIEQLIYREFGYDNVKLLVGNSPGHLASRALATGLGYIALKRIDQYTNEKVIEIQAQGHIKVLEHSGDKLNKDTLEQIYQNARSTHSPSLLSRAEDLAVGVASNVVKQVVIAVKDSLDK